MSNTQSHFIPTLETQAPITVREGTAADAPAIERLAQLDSRPVPAGPVFVAEVAGEVRAALPVDGGEAISDPFHRTAELISILRLSTNAGTSARRSAIRMLGRTGGARSTPRPSAPSVPGIPALPSQRA